MNYWDPIHLAALPLSAYTPGKGDPEMEGGFTTATGAPMYTLEAFRRGEAPYVTGATSAKNPSGQLVYRQLGNETIPVRITDHGPGVKGIDIATENSKWATKFPYQGQTDAPMGPITNYGAVRTKPNEITYTTPEGAPMMSSMDYYKQNITPAAPGAPPAGPTEVGKGFAVAGAISQELGSSILKNAQAGTNSAFQQFLARGRPQQAVLQALANAPYPYTYY